MQPDRRLVQHIENARCAVAHGAGKLHTLTLAGGKRGGGAVKGQIAKPEIRQPLGGAAERNADALCHGTHFLGQAAGDTLHPVNKVRQRHGAGFVKRYAAQLGRAGGAGQACAAAVRANILFQELLHPLHALFVPYLGKGIFHGVNCIIIGKIQLTRLI